MLVNDSLILFVWLLAKLTKLAKRLALSLTSNESSAVTRYETESGQLLPST